MEKEHPLVQLARRTIEAHVRTGEQLEPPPELEAQEQRRAGAFVSLHCHGQLRGCIGTLEPTQANVVCEVIQNAISAANHDPRFSPIRPDELESLEISVDILGKAEPIKSIDDLDPVQFGVIVERGPRRGLLLPNLDGVETAEMQVAISLRKAGIRPDEPYHMYRFRVDRYY
jgi:MEMO1 family protein